MLRSASCLPLAIFLSLGTPGLLNAQGSVPLGPEFRVNTYTTNTQRFPALTIDPSGNFVITWDSTSQDGSTFGVFAQRYASSGAPLGGEFRVNTSTLSAQRYPSVASDSAGNFVVAWASNQDGSYSGIFAQRFASTGSPLGGEFRVNTYTTGYQYNPAVASDAVGNFVVTWHSFPQDGSSYGIFAQRFGSSGVPLGGEFRVNSYTTGVQSYPVIASDPAGNFVVVWNSLNQDGNSSGVFAQRFANTGTPLGGEFRANTYTTGGQFSPSVAIDSAGALAIAWESAQDDEISGGIFSQRFASTGAPLGVEFRVNTYTTNQQFDPAVSSDSSGNFVIAWSSNGADGDGNGIFAQRYDSAGTAVGGEFRVNSFTTSNQIFPTLATNPGGDFVVAWMSETQDGDLNGIFGQRFVSVPLISVGDCVVAEGDTGTQTCTFTLSLSAPSSQTVTVNFATADATATSGLDYVAASGTATFPPGNTAQGVAVTILGEVMDEPDETFVLNLSSPVNGTIADAQGVGTIQDNDPPPSVSISDCAVVEGDAGSTPCEFTISLSAVSGFTVTVSYATADGTATAGSDYTAASGALTFLPGTASQPLSVLVLGDITAELDETFLVNLSGPTNATLGDAQGLATIGDDDIVSLSSAELHHASRLQGEFEVKPDYYRLGQSPFSSYEVMVDGTSGDIVPLALDRLAGDNATVVQSATAIAVGASVSLRWENATPLTVINQHIRVDGSCAAPCGPEDVYTIGAFETTYSIARFNNGGTQVTVLILQNPTGYPVTGHVWFWKGEGTQLGSHAFSLAPRQALVLNTATVPGIAGQGGTMTITNDARYGDLAGKTVALEPSTGFSFDSPMIPRPR
jgi:hypothetical protein